MADTASVAAGFALFSGVVLGAVGLGLLLLRPRRAPAAAFGLFLLLWCGLVVAGNLARLAAIDLDAAAAEGWVLVSLPFLVLLYAPLAYFAAIEPDRQGLLAARRGWGLLFLAPAAAGAAALALAPGWLYQGLVGTGAATRSLWGPLHPVYVALFIGAFYYAIWELDRHQRRTQDPRRARRALALMGALGLYAAYWAPEALFVYGAALLAGPADALLAWSHAVALLLAVAGCALLARVGARALRDPRPEPAAMRRYLALSFGLPAFAGAASGLAAASGALPVTLETLGLWRTLAACAVAYAIARHDLFDLELGRALGDLGQARSELARERRFSERFVATSPDGIVAVDAAGRVTLWNPALEALTGLRRAEALGQPMAQALPALAAGRGGAALAEALAGRAAVAELEGLAGAPGERLFEARAAPLPDEGGGVQGALALVRDVTARRRAEEERRRAEERLKDVQRLEELQRMKTQFINAAAHELNTPLTTILIQAELLKGGPGEGLSPGQQKSLAILDRNLGRLSQLVQDVLESARLQSGRLAVAKEPLDLNLVVSEAVESFQEPARRAGVRVVAQLGAPLEVQADPKRLHQVLFNLLTNALKFTPEGGTVTVEAAHQGDEAVVRVRDTGLGLRREDLARLFQPFSQVHAGLRPGQADGAGLGLYICKGIVEQHGGRIGAESPGPGRGATFHFAVPLRAARSAPARAEPRPQPPA